MPRSTATDEHRRFKDCDIRGTYPDQVNEDIFARVGREFGRLLAEAATAAEDDTVVIGGDGRQFDAALMEATIRGLSGAPIGSSISACRLRPRRSTGRRTISARRLRDRHRLAQPAALGRAEGDAGRPAAAARGHRVSGRQKASAKARLIPPAADCADPGHAGPRCRITWTAMTETVRPPSLTGSEGRGRSRQRLHVRRRFPSVARPRREVIALSRPDRPRLLRTQPRLRRAENLRPGQGGDATRRRISASASTGMATGLPSSTTPGRMLGSERLAMAAVRGTPCPSASTDKVILDIKCSMHLDRAVTAHGGDTPRYAARAGTPT
jgi:hypothetical protein